MSAESEIVSVTADIKDAVVQETGFGVVMIVGSHEYATRLIGPFTSAEDLVAAPYSFASTHPLYLKARALMSQNSAPAGFKIGKRLLEQTQVVRLTPATPAAGLVYALTVDGAAIEITAAPGDTAADVVDDMVTAIGALADVTATDGTTYCTATTDTVGTLHAYENLSNITLKDMTTDPGIATDLSAIKAADDASATPGFYGLLTDGYSEAQIAAVAAWAEAQTIIHCAVTGDTEVLDSAVTTDIASDLETAGYHRSPIIFHHKPISQAADAAWMGMMFPKAPGGASWMAKSLAGVDAMVLTAPQRATALAKHVNIHINMAGGGWTQEGWAPSGRYVDVTQAVDWFMARLTEGIIGAMRNNDKIAQTNKDTQIIRQIYDGVIAQGVLNRAIDPETPATIVIPKVENLPDNDRRARRLTGVRFAFRLAGAFHRFEIRGTISV